MRIRSKILLVVFSMIMATGLSVVLVVRSISKDILEEQMIGHLATVAEIKTRYINSILREYKEITALTSTGNVFIDLVSETENTEEATETVDRRIRAMLISYNDISRFRVLNRNGTVIVSSHSDVGADLSEDPLFLHVTDDGGYTSELHFSQFTDNPVFSISAPVYRFDEFVGAVVVNFDADKELFSSITDRTGLGETGEVYIIDSKGLMLTPSLYIEDAALTLEVDLETAGGIREVCGFGNEEHEHIAVFTRNYMGSDVISIHSHIPDINCVLIAEISVDEAFAPVDRLTQSMLVVMAGVLLFGVFLSVPVSSGLANPIEKLKKGVEEIMKGNLGYRIKTGAKDETGELSRAFCDMTEELSKSREALEEYTENLETRISERTIELKRQFEKSENQRIATLNMLQDLDESSSKLKDEIRERKRTGKVLEQRVSQLAALGKIGRSIASMLELDALLELTVSLIHESFGYRYVSILLIDPATGMLAIRAGAGFNSASTKGISLKVGEDSVCGYVAYTGKHMLVGDVRLEPRHFPVDAIPDSRSELTVPVSIEGRVIGVLDVQSDDVNAFDEQDAHIIRLMADQAAIAIENARLFERAAKELSERETAEKALEAEKEMLAVTLRSIGDAVITTDTGGKIIMMNRVAEELTGWLQNKAAGKKLAEVFNIIDESTKELCRDPVDEILESMDTVSYFSHTILVEKSGLERSIAYSCAPITDQKTKLVGAVVVFHDVTEERKTEEELRKAARLESIGILAGGLAHDFNNMLSAILGNISLAKMSLEPEGDVYRILTKSENASMRARDLTQQLLTFSKGGAPVRETTSIDDLIRETVNFALGGSKSRGKITTSEDLWAADVDKGQISEVISNLIINADQAMPEGGVITVTAENKVVGQYEIPSLPEGRYVSISVSDSGIGIPANQLEKIFDPYYTTKQKGSGLGLSIVYSILRKHDGCITVDSEVATGTEFRVYIPASNSNASAETDPRQAIHFGAGSVLVMDDDKMVCDVAGEMLQYLGYSVDFAENGEEALRKYREAMESEKPFDVVIMDLTIPGGMGGRKAVVLLLNMDPGAKAIVSSGYSEDTVMGRYKQFGFSGCIKKPYCVTELGKVIHDIMNGSGVQT
ncbi:MAG: GAF domain-containing protein [Candidatus Sabulitectum sp.]|nr:GAF domain-containing protein [Candidatus Sabulitectum sp.]